MELQPKNPGKSPILIGGVIAFFLMMVIGFVWDFLNRPEDFYAFRDSETDVFLLLCLLIFISVVVVFEKNIRR